MNDENREEFGDIAGGVLRKIAEQRRDMRSQRRIAILNVVQMARQHAGRDGEPYSQNEADTVMAIMELIDRIADTPGTPVMTIHKLPRTPDP